MKTSFVVTILNEEQTIGVLLDSVTRQSQILYEVIIVDGGSTDKTTQKVEEFIKKKKGNVSIKLIEKKGNRSVGRNEGIRQAKGDIILISDAGCVLDKDWVKEITKPFSNKTVDVVAGYYRGKAETVFQKCVIPYVLVMPDKVNSQTFLPATRSMAIRKKVCEELGGFPEEYSHNEDYVFAKRLKKEKKKIVFAREVLVSWIPPRTIKKAFVMFYRFAFGDIESGITRPKVILVFTRYIIATIFLVTFLLTKDIYFLILIFLGFALYIVWSILKNYQYNRHWQSFFLFPILQITTDAAVLIGSTLGAFKSFLFSKK